MGLLDRFMKSEIDEPEDIERKARRIAVSHEELVGKYDDRTEEVITLLREKAEGLFDCRKYFDMASEFKDEIAEIKKDKAKTQSEINAMKRRWGELGEKLLGDGLIGKPQDIKNQEDFMTFLECIQFTDKDVLPMKNILAAWKRLKIDRVWLEENHEELYANLKIKDWEV